MYLADRQTGAAEALGKRTGGQSHCAACCKPHTYFDPHRTRCGGAPCS